MDDDEDERFEEGEFEDEEDTSEDDDHEMEFSDHSSDEGESDCTRKSANSSPISGDNTSLRKYTCGRHTIYRGGHTGPSNSSHTRRGDPIGETQGVVQSRTNDKRLLSIHDDDDDDDDDDFNHNSDADNEDGGDTPNHTSQRDSNYGVISCNTSQKPSIRRVGEKFASFTVHHTICTILREHLTEPWITFRKVPQDVRKSMYNRFKTRWSWNPECEQNTYEGFINVLKSRYSDIMYNLKLQSTNKAIDAGFDINERDYTQFSIIRNYPPDSIPEGVWSQMCDLWDTDTWRKKSESAKRNRSSVKGSDKSSRHTAGSIGYDEYRVRLRKIMRKEPNYKDIFLMTHLNKDSKAKFLAGELSVNSLDEMDFCTNRAKDAYVNVDYVMTGKSSTSSGIAQSDHDQRLSQEKIHNLEVQMEAEKKAREELQEQMRQERQEMQNQMNEAIRKGIEEFMRNLHPADDRIMDVCLEINRRRQKWIESDEDEEDVDLETVNKNNEDSDDNNNHEVDLGCPSFSLGFTQEQHERKGLEQSGTKKPEGESKDKFQGCKLGAETEDKDVTKVSGDKVCIDKPDQILNQRFVVDEYPTFSLGLTQEGNQEEYNQTIGKGLSENMKACVVSENVTIADRKFVGKTKKDILLEKYSANVPKPGGLKDSENEVVQESCMKPVMLKDEIPTFSLGLTQEVRREETNKITGQREIGDETSMTFVADKMNAADGKMMGRSKSEIVAEKFGASGAMNEGINAPRPKVVGWTKADILAEKRKATAKIEAKKDDSKNKFKVEPKQGLMKQNVSEKEIETTTNASMTPTKVHSFIETSDKHLDKSCGENEAGKNVIKMSIESDVKVKNEQKREASKSSHETVVVKSKRLKGVSRECKSPYLLREVEITNRYNKEENSVWDYIVKLSDEKQPAKGSKKVVLGSEEANSDCNEMEFIFETSNGPMTEAKFFKTLIPGNRIYGELIDCWATVLNAEEKLRSPDSPYRLFCGHRVFLKWMFTAPKTDESVRLVALTKMMFDAVGRVESMRALKSYDIVIIPLLENDHFYVMTFDLKNPGIYLLDNMDRDETIVSIKDHKDYYKKDTPYKVKHMFVRYLEKFQHPRADKISMQKVTRVDLQWATIGNITDCGIFAMRHMEMFMGSHCRNFDCGFKTSEKQVITQIQTLRKKYACRILLSDINVQKQKLLAKVGL
ncbi:hypothetical protein E3N88_32835 [Mikania micrantha]|uniref:Ubiquitin-like protease family profile domain-containing protein n=1 Tax=Mikania micrantha TaxID=192012 RepID=A0A5N6M9I1_9ASTR|nr:hypothetical protein E3N88_32835 [Mikania micrantha]